MAHPNRLQNARVLVFGGTSGIGFGVASMALSNGATVIISGSQQPKVDEKVKELQSFYPSLPASRISGIACDLADIANVEANLTAVFDNVTDNGTNKIDHLVHCAGDAIHLPKIPEFRVETAFNGFHVRWLAAVCMGKLLATGKYMPQAVSSSFTFTSGTNVAKPMPGWSLGASWGGAVEGLGRGLAVDLKPIRVNVVAPGAIDTPLFQKFKDNVGEEVANNMREKYSLLGKWGDVTDTAETYGWLMRDWFATGNLASTDGGRRLVG